MDKPIKQDPTLREIFLELPHEEEDHEAIAESIIDGKPVARSDGRDYQDGRIVFTITLASDDLMNVHTSSHEVRGGPKDSGRAEIIGIMTVITYLSHVIEWHNLLRDSEIPIYCDNREAVDFCALNLVWTTPRWADNKNTELKKNNCAISREHEERNENIPCRWTPG